MGAGDQGMLRTAMAGEGLCSVVILLISVCVHV